MVFCSLFPAVLMVAAIIEFGQCSTENANGSNTETWTLFYTAAFLIVVGSLTTLSLVCYCLQKAMAHVMGGKPQVQKHPVPMKKELWSQKHVVPSEIFVAKGSNCFHINCYHLKRKGASFSKLRLCAEEVHSQQMTTLSEVFVAAGSDVFQTECHHLKHTGVSFIQLRLCSDCAKKRG